MKRWKRKRVTVDIRLQGACCLRVAIYWITCLATVVLMMTCRLLLTGSPGSVTQLVQQVWGQCGGFVVGAMLVLPLVLFDLLVVTNRFAGPIYRIRQELNKLADGEPTRPVQLRPKDFCEDLASAYNRVREHVVESTVAESSDSDDVTCREEDEAELVAT